MADLHDLRPVRRFAAYAHPERLGQHRVAGGPDRAGAVGGPDGIVVLESDEDVLLYDTGHIPGALKLDWHQDLNDPVMRDYVDAEQFAAVMSARGVGRDTTVVIYGDKNNWWAAYALWVMSLFGHEDVRLLDGGRAKWVAEGRELTKDVPQVAPLAGDAAYPVVERDDAPIRAFKDDVLAHLGGPLVDVRSPGEYTGELLHMPDYPQEGAMRGGHIPGAKSVPWARAANEDGTFKSREDLEAIYLAGAGPDALRRRRSPTAASASGRRTPGSCSPTCSASTTSATTTARGPSGATPCASRSSRERRVTAPVAAPPTCRRRCRRSPTTSRSSLRRTPGAAAGVQ